jgi:hypothetical protein
MTPQEQPRRHWRLVGPVLGYSILFALAVWLTADFGRLESLVLIAIFLLIRVLYRLDTQARQSGS